MSDRPSEPPSAPPPTRAEVEAELQRVLASRCFEQAGRAQDFLRFVIGEALAGRGDRLKGYTIALQVFDRPPDFDAQTDPLVRVEARRLRSRLLEYYSTEGDGDPVRIELPRGGYAPKFERTAANRSAANRTAPPAPAPQPQTEPAARVVPKPSPGAAAEVRVRRIAVAIATVAVVFALVAVLSPREWRDRVLGRGSAAPAAEAPRRPSVLLPTFANLSGDADFDYFSYGITEDVATHLGALGVVVIRGPSADDTAAGGSAAAPSAAHAADYALTGSVRPAPDRIRVSARLVVAGTGAQLWAEAFDEPADMATLLSIQERIAERVAVAIAQPFGPIFSNEARAAAQRPTARLDTYDCVLRYRYYRRNIDVAGHAQSLQCFRGAIVREPGYADAWAGLALIYLDEHLFEYNPQPDQPDAIARALEAARKALDIDGGNALANLAMTRVRFALGDTSELDRALERVITSRSSAPDDFLTIGVLFGVKGDWDRGLPLIDRAAELAGPDRPGLFALGYALHSLQTSDYDEALRHALRVDMPRWYVATTIVTVAASLADRPDIARRSAEQLLEQRPEMARELRAELAKWSLNDDLAATFIRGLGQAGIAAP